MALVTAAAMSVVSAQSALKSWNFEGGTGDFAYDKGWDYQYSGGKNTSVEAEGGRLKVNVDYSADGASSWSQMTLVSHENISIKGADSVSFDLYYDGALLKDGAALKAKVTLQDGSYKEETNGDAQADTDAAADAVGLKGYKLTRVTVKLGKTVSCDTCATFALALVGSNTDYKGALYIDNIDVGLGEPEKDVAVDSTVKVTGGAAQIAVSGAPSSAAMVDPDADDAARALYAYLAAVPKMGKMIYGHQDDTFQKAGSSELSGSDTKDVTGSIAGIIGVDALAMTGAEYSTDKFNAAHPGQEVPNTASGGVKAAAIMSKEAIAEGAIITVSAHMPNFSLVKAGKGGKESYAKWDFGGYTPNNLEGGTANRILPGGDLNAKYNAYLDMIADYASQVGDTILFRPFHECTGSWFWWGAAHCDAEQFKNMYRYTVAYLRDVKGLHNIIYVYGPGMEAESVDDYAVRYPGDEWVDMVGFDSYNIDPSPDDGWFEKFAAQAKVTSDFAKAHGKLFAVTETGMGTSHADGGDSQTVLHKSGNKVLNWYEKVADVAAKYGASYFLLWANFSKHDGYYTPYVDKVNEDGTLHGHETLDGFIKFFNDERSVFAVNQKDALASRASNLKLATVKNDKPIGFICSPVAGSRMLKAGAVNVWVKNAEGKKLEVLFKGAEGKSATIPVMFKKGVYSAKIKGGDFKKLGAAEGTVELLADGAVLASNRLLINLKEVPDDPMVVDDFEKYMGSDAVLNTKWAVNKDAGCSIKISIDTAAEGMDGAAYKFEYKETATGWAGATVNKTADWSKANALQFKTIPDGNNQLVVIQITAGGKVYEVYMNDYDAYRDKKNPMTVTIPFSQFCSRDEGGKPKGGLEKDKGTITGFGLWLNAIKDTPAVVDGIVSGTIWYDSIKAVKSSATEVVIE